MTLEPHYFVAPKATKTASAAGTRGLARLASACGRNGCGKPPHHPIHLRHPDEQPERQAAVG